MRHGVGLNNQNTKTNMNGTANRLPYMFIKRTSPSDVTNRAYRLPHRHIATSTLKIVRI